MSPRGRERRPYWPEIVLAAILVLVASFFFIGSSSAACHHWRDRLHEVYSSLLSSNSLPDSPPRQSRQGELSRQVQEVLEQRPPACL